MSRHQLVDIVALVLIWGCLAPAVNSADGGEVKGKTNIVLILADDLGWADTGCYGADLHETPNIDRLARQGVRFTHAYAMPVCSPTRATLLTGKHAARLQITIWAEEAGAGPRDRKLLQAASLGNLPHSETTLASHLQAAGYLTALVGKWHLGDADHYPETHGFDVNIGGTRWGAPQTFFWPYHGRGSFGKEFRYIPHLEFGRPGEYLTDRLTDEAISVIDRAGDQPFFLYLAHHAVHTPIEAKAPDIEYFANKRSAGLNHQHAGYAAMVKNLDANVGRLLDHLETRGLDQNTLVIFTSDNGGYIGAYPKSGESGPVTNNAPLRSGKGSLYEGGIRVPLLVRQPGVAPPEAVCDEPVILTDLFATCLNAAGAAGAPDAQDGLDISRLLADPTARLDRPALYFHYPHYFPTATPVGAMRAGNWKLLEFFEDNRVELYDLAADPSEKEDLAPKMPERAAEMRERLHAWRKNVNAAMPTVNPQFKQAK